MQNYKTNYENYYTNYQKNERITSPYKDNIRQMPKRKKYETPKKAKTFAVCLWTLIILGATLINKSNFLDPVYINRIENKNLNFNAENIMSPTLKYMTNLNMMNTNLLAKVPNKGKEKIIPINSNGELTSLKNEINNMK